MARYWGQQNEEAFNTVGGGSENLQGVSASDRARWDGKQDQLVYDNKPARGSVNVLNSDAVARAFEEFKDAISTAYKQYLTTQVTSYAEMVAAVTNAKNDVDNAYAAIEKYETNMRVLYEDALSKLTDAQNILAGATTLLNKTNTESSALSAKIKQLESVHSSIISDLGVLRNALAEVSNDADGAQVRIEELISKANDVDARVAGLVKTVEDALAEIETEKEDTLAKIRAVRDSIPEDYEKVCEDVKEVRQELIDARRRGTWITSETASGEMVHATNCAPVPPLNIKPYGKTEQPSTEGNQLFDGTLETLLGSTDGVIIVKGGIKSAVMPIIGGETYTISILTSDTVFTCTTSEYPSVGTTIVDAYSGTAGIKVNKKTIKTSANAKYLVVGFGSIEDPTDYGIMVNKGNTALPWEPYTGGEASPNMNCPQPLNSHGDGGSIVGKVLTSQFFDCEKASDSSNWVDSTVLANIKAFPVYVGKGNKLTFSYKQTLSVGLGFYLYISLTNEKRDYFVYHSNDSSLINNDIEFTATEDYIYLLCYEAQIPLFMQYIGNDLMIKISSVTTEHELYSEQPFTVLTPNGLKGIPLGQTIPNAIKNSPIHMAGVYWDKAEGQYYIGDTKDCENGKGIQRVGRYKITGNEDWTYHSTAVDGSEGWHCRPAIGNLALPDTIHGMFTHFTTGALNQSGGSYGFVGADTIQVIDVNKLTSLNTLKEFFQNNDVYVDYILEEPIIIDLTQEELDQYNALLMNYPNTTVVNDAGAYMEVKYGKDAEAYINENYTPRSEHEALEQRVKIIEEEIIKL